MPPPDHPMLFDMELRELRRARARRLGPELFIHERAFGDCLERLALLDRRFERALLVGSRSDDWLPRLGQIAASVELFDDAVADDCWDAPELAYDLVVSIGSLDTVNDLPLALAKIRRALAPGGLLIGAVAGGNSLPQLRQAMRAADAVTGAAAPHVHPRIEPAALAPLLDQAGFARPVVDIDRAQVAYRSLDRLIGDLRAMGATNILPRRPRFAGRSARNAAEQAFAVAGEDGRTVELFEILHFAAWSGQRLKPD
ncbi:MAG: methyltransferase domain-containing protein [Sphingomicrobium sp.]